MQHTVSLETARKLHEAGIEFPQSIMAYVTSFKDLKYRFFISSAVPQNAILSAPILTELLEVLPKTIQLDGVWHFFTLESVEDYYVSYDNAVGEPYNGLGFNHKKPCEAAAELLLKLKREGII